MRDRQKELMRFDRPALEDALRQAGADFVTGAKMVCCPFHGDKTPSASIHQADDGHWAIRCFTCGETWDYFDVLAKAKGVTVGDLLRESGSNGHQERAGNAPSGPATAQAPPQATQGTPPRSYADLAAVKALVGGAYRAHYAYTDPATGKIDLLAVRFMAVKDEVKKKLVPNADGKIKTFWQLHTKTKGGPFFFGGTAGAHPLYNRTRMLKADEVIVCYAEDTEVLTNSGWVFFPKLRDQDQVACYNPVGSKITFSQPTGIQKFSFDGDLVHFKADWCDMAVTPDHRVLRRFTNLKWSVRPASKVGLNNRLPVSGLYAGGEDGPTEMQARMVACYCADGHRPPRGAQLVWNIKKERKKERLRWLFSLLGITWVEHIYPSKPEWTQFNIRKDSVSWLLNLAPKRNIEMRMMHWPLSSREALMDELRYWDGDSVGQRGSRLFTAEEEEAQAVAAIGAVTGYSSITRHDQRRGLSNWVVNLNHTEWRMMGKKPQSMPYSGLVWCCTVPTGFIVTRRNGKVTISGNCEGEKDVHTLTELGFTATTWPGGALSTHAVDWSPLAGKKRVILWPDNDEPGMKAMVGAAAALRALADPPLQLAQVNPQWIGLGDVAEDHGKDVTDFLAELCPDDSRDTKRTILREILDRQVESLSAVGDLLRRIESIASGARRPLRMTFGALGKLTQMLIPGTVSLICGQPGARKSFFINQLSLDFYEKGVKMATLALEEDVTYHTTRSLAQVSGTANMTEEQWIFDHAAQAHALTLEWKDFLDGYARTITDSKEGTIAYSKIIDWVRRKIASGARVLIVDPLTSAEPDNDEPVPKADKKLILLLKKIAVEAEVSIVLVTHPRDGADKMPYGDRMAGGAAFKRFCQTQLFLEMHPEPLEGLTFVGDSLVRQQDDSDPPVTNTVHITKARNGRGTGMKIAFHFDPATLCFRELGVVREDKKKKGRWQ